MSSASLLHRRFVSVDDPPTFRPFLPERGDAEISVTDLATWKCATRRQEKRHHDETGSRHSIIRFACLGVNHVGFSVVPPLTLFIAQSIPANNLLIVDDEEKRRLPDIEGEMPVGVMR